MFIRRGLNSKHSLALYEALKDYQNIGRIRMAIEAFRKLVGVEADQYKIFTMLKKRIIDTAVQEINEKTDLKVVYDLENEGRKITAIVFRVSGTAPHESIEKASEEIMHKLNGMGIKESVAKELLSRHDEDYILANIRIVEEELKSGKEIRNIPAYLMKAFSVDFRHVETEFEKAQTAKKQQKSLELKQAEEQEAQKAALQKVFEKQRLEAVAGVLERMSAEELSSSKATFLEEINTNPLFKKILESKGLDSAPIQAQRINFIAKKHLPKTASEFDEFLKVAKYDTKMGTSSGG